MDCVGNDLYGQERSKVGGAGLEPVTSRMSTVRAVVASSDHTATLPDCPCGQANFVPCGLTLSQFCGQSGQLWHVPTISVGDSSRPCPNDDGRRRAEDPAALQAHFHHTAQLVLLFTI